MEFSSIIFIDFYKKYSPYIINVMTCAQQIWWHFCPWVWCMCMVHGYGACAWCMEGFVSSVENCTWRVMWHVATRPTWESL